MSKKQIKCFQCGNPDCGEWDEVRQKTYYHRNAKGWPICAECKYPEPDDGSWIPTAEDDQKMVDQYHLRKYGEY